jgi:hypothetical protein
MSTRLHELECDFTKKLLQFRPPQGSSTGNQVYQWIDQLNKSSN